MAPFDVWVMVGRGLCTSGEPYVSFSTAAAAVAAVAAVVAAAAVLVAVAAPRSLYYDYDDFREHPYCVRVLHIKALFLPVGILHTQCPCRLFSLERYQLCGNKATTQRYYIVMQ